MTVCSLFYAFGMKGGSKAGDMNMGENKVGTDYRLVNKAVMSR